MLGGDDGAEELERAGGRGSGSGDRRRQARGSEERKSAIPML